ncbi:MAG: bifunctional 4-hydroxy-2-oxoglutarate aldolase/2-dehydro-3-deoxy-phosphogluconate aldolase [Dokdonella sp.]|uniref:bifunctional 4-hydroxy-2-oxoglutarate aldolase/2-dehydro-3-deoxy-phosphogluconate aldolase n=1 Tax=Dokdonella sp. TaxID=2291710 RepID=UPI0032654EAF
MERPMKDDALFEASQQAAIALLRATRVLPVVTVESAEQGVATARALLEGGLTAIEVTLRTPAALDAIAAIRQHVPGIALGAGTVVSERHIAAARTAGATFLVTPGTPPALAHALVACGLPVVPGAATPSELIALSSIGFRVAKLFPAAAIGGIALIRALQGPLADLLLCPTGGITETDASTYLAQKNVVAVGGSWMVPRAWIEQGNFAAVTDASRKASAL